MYAFTCFLDPYSDPDTMYLLAALQTWPVLNMTFDPRQTEYHTEVAHDQIVIQIGAFAMSCDCEARLEDKYGVARSVQWKNLVHYLAQANLEFQHRKNSTVYGLDTYREMVLSEQLIELFLSLDHFQERGRHPNRSHDYSRET